MSGSSDFNDYCYEAWQRGIRAQCEQHGLIYEQDDFLEEYAEFDGFMYDRTKITADDDSFIGHYEDRYGAFNPADYEVDPALVAPLTFKQIMQRTSPVTDAFTSHSHPLAMNIAEHYHSMCLADVHRQLKIAVRKHIQRMYVVNRLQDFFEWAVDTSRIHVTPHLITFTLPDYDDPENPEEDDEVVIPVAAFNVKTTPTSLGKVPHLVILHLLLTPDAIHQISPHRFPPNLHISGSVRLSLSIPHALITQ